MEKRRTQAPAWVCLFAACCALGRLATASPEGQQHWKLTVGKDSDFESVMRALEREGPEVCVADVSTVDFRSLRPLQDAAPATALAKVSLEFDRFWIQRGNSLALQLRYSAPTETAAPEIEEVRLMAEDMYRLIRPFAPRFLGLETMWAKHRFGQSLTTMQQQRMINGGLPFIELSKDQREAWLTINSSQAYALEVLEFYRLNRCLQSWRSATLVGVDRPDEGGYNTRVQYSDPGGPDGDPGGAKLHFPTANLQPSPPSSQGESRPAPEKRLPESLRKPWRLLLTRFKLGDLPRRLEEAGGPKVTVPDYAAGRQFWAYSRGGSHGSVLLALCDLWGWELRPDSRGDGYVVGRPRIPAAANALELHGALKRAVPPSVMHPLRVVQARGSERWGTQLGLVVAAVQKLAGTAKRPVAVTALDAENQQRAAGWTAVLQLSSWFSRHGKQDQLTAYFAHPEKGVFRLSRTIRPGDYPLLMFTVPDWDGGEISWGMGTGPPRIVKQ